MNKYLIIGIGSIFGCMLLVNSHIGSIDRTYPVGITDTNTAINTSNGHVIKPVKKLEADDNFKEIIYNADIQQGMIGLSAANPVDNPKDNIFHVVINELPSTNAIAYLQYDVFGIANQTGIARSINNNQATGGQFVQLHQNWSSQKEAIAISSLQKGDNIIRFAIPKDAGYYYRIRNLFITVKQMDAIKPGIIVANDSFQIFHTKAYCKGIIALPPSNDDSILNSISLFCNGQKIPVYNGEFEATINLTDDGLEATKILFLEAVLPNGKHITKTISPSLSVKPTFENADARKGITSYALYSPKQSFSLVLPQVKEAGIKIPQNALTTEKKISITALRAIDIPALGTDMVNVTKGADAFRFLPHGAKFSRTAQVSIPFDSILIPEGYTADDIHTYYFDEQQKEWLILSLDSVLVRDGIVLSKTTHFTDMINGIIKVPESPQTQGYTPTSIKDIKAANPSLGINLIEPPSANNTGSASLGFQLKIPKGRSGIQPQLGLSYNNEAGNGWLGIGWNLGVPSIGIETRWVSYTEKTLHCIG